jgi:hypothetical protein
MKILLKGCELIGIWITARIHKILVDLDQNLFRSGRRTGKNSIIRNALLELQSEGVKIILVSYPCSKKIIPEKNAIYVHVPKSEYADENFKDIWFTHPKYSDEPIETKTMSNINCNYCGKVTTDSREIIDGYWYHRECISLSKNYYSPTEYKCSHCGQYKYHEGLGYDDYDELICLDCKSRLETEDEG